MTSRVYVFYFILLLLLFYSILTTPHFLAFVPLQCGLFLSFFIQLHLFTPTHPDSLAVDPGDVDQ